MSSSHDELERHRTEFAELFGCEPGSGEYNAKLERLAKLVANRTVSGREPVADALRQLRKGR